MTPVRGILCDLDGVVYRAHLPCPGAVEGLASAREAGVRVVFMTNNASRTPEAVAEQLTSLGVPTDPDEVLTASQVAAAVVAAGHPELTDGEGAVLAVGGPGVAAALQERGIRTVDAAQVQHSQETGPITVRLVVQGYGAEVGITDLTEAAYAVGAGADWVATNGDATLPTERGMAPGNGSLVAAVQHATGAEPLVVGKPHSSAYEEALARLDLPEEECLMIGDRLDTDIAGARAVGLRTALVLTGVSTRAEAEEASPASRPDLVVETLPELAHLWESS